MASRVQELRVQLPDEYGELLVSVMPSDLFACERIFRESMEELKQEVVVGLDAEWKPGSPPQHGADLLQLAAAGRCFVFRLNGRAPPPSLSELLGDPNLAKAGVGVATDVERLNKGNQCVVKGELEVRVLAQALELDPGGLAKLCHEVLHIELDKSLQSSDWGAPQLSTEQLCYAAVDAWASREMAHALCLRSRKVQGASLHAERPSSSVTNQELREYVQPFLGIRSVRKRGKAAGSGLSGPSAGPGRVKTRTSARIATRKAPLYENCRILAPDGAVLCTCGRKKINWYLNKGIAVLEGEDPPTIRLKFEPNGRGHADDQYYLSDKSNICCVCGHKGKYLRHSVVPPCYRQHFPEEMKSHLSHDIVLVCVECKQRVNTSDHERMVRLGIEFEAPLEGGGKGQVMRYEVDERASAARSAARAIAHYTDTMPASRLLEQYQVLQKYMCTSEISDAHVQECCALEVKHEAPGFVAHAELVVLSLKHTRPDYQGPSSSQHSNIAGGTANSIQSLSEEGREALETFVRDWRRHFLASMSPRFLPAHWCVENRVVNSASSCK
eukprot:CAMPEP_0114285810 /NCGR_PEP_ID=MMETSP0059-20121206/5405_1 /TAXON_ID=36894 /ORGANISM="Pyramimonas parkeae, Strain CCMP726" /LENGTH=555 /DNA_ID=CAMNT_0001406773 /DNA_START=243 /DNA_END=1910 /DNA_ORIENTATION=+